MSSGSIWTRPEPGTRRPRFSRDRIAAAALAIADAEGFGAVSMRRIAADLGAGTMTLYHYVRTKDDLVVLMDDALMGETLLPPGELPAGWREALTAIARRTRAVYQRHPWALSVLQGEAGARSSLAGPNAMRHFEQSFAAVADLPAPLSERLELLAIVDDYVFGHVLRAREAHAREETTPEAARAAHGAVEAQLRTGDFPHLRALAEQPDAVAAMADGRLDGRFERGLAALLDGVEARLRDRG